MLWNAVSLRARLRPFAVVPLFVMLLVPLSVATGQTVAVDGRGRSISIEDTDRILSLGSAITEIVYALDRADDLVGVDASSEYPDYALEGVPRVGYVRDLSAEGVIALNPGIVLASMSAGPPDVIAQIEDAGVPVFFVPEDITAEAAIERIQLMGEILDEGETAEELVADMERDLRRAREFVEPDAGNERPRIMFIYARGPGAVNVSGHGTSAHAMIELAGGANAVDGYTGYRPLTPEAAVIAEPDILLFMDSGLDSIGGPDEIANIPGLSQTPAFENDRVLAFDGTYLLGFGPRMGEAVLELAEAIHSEAP
ncbi:MAG: hemin ABC transporter substrate-binding protein [Spirochaetaceae bacterium]